LTERHLLSLLFFIVSLPSALVPSYLGMPGGPYLGLACVGLVVCLAVLGVWWRTDPVPVRYRILGAAFTLAILLSLLGGQGNLFHANPDWLTRNAVLRDLVVRPWPVIYRVQDHDWLLRAPLGLYMLPAIAGKCLGPRAAVFALLSQSVLIFSLIFYFLVPANRSSRQGLIILGVFCIFSGWDIVGTLANLISGTKWPAEGHIEWWAHLFQYSSTITQLFWVPNHATPGWIFACLYLRWVRSETSLGLVLASVPVLAFWSPLAAMGMVPFAGFAGLKTLIDRRVTWADIAMPALALAAALPALWYEHLAAGTVTHGLLLTHAGFWAHYPAFMALEVLPSLTLIVWASPDPARDPTLLLTALVLFAIPFYRIGEADDFAMRASIPALAVLAVRLGSACADARARAAGRAWTMAACTSLAIGGVTGLLEVRRAVIEAPVAISDRDLPSTWERYNLGSSLAHYIVAMDRAPAWLHSRPEAAVPRRTRPTPAGARPRDAALPPPG
jgi:hypothetical protein